MNNIRFAGLIAGLPAGAGAGVAGVGHAPIGDIVAAVGLKRPKRKKRRMSREMSSL